MVNWAELRSWVQVLVVVVAAAVALRTYLINQRQRRLENGMRLAEWFHASLLPGDLDQWRVLLTAKRSTPGESSGSLQGGRFQGRDGQEFCFADLFQSSDSVDNGALRRLTELLDFISRQCLAGAADARFIYFELGQLLETVHLLVSRIDIREMGYPESASFVASGYPYLHRFVKKEEEVHRFWPGKTYAIVP